MHYRVAWSPAELPRNHAGGCLFYVAHDPRFHWRDFMRLTSRCRKPRRRPVLYSLSARRRGHPSNIAALQPDLYFDAHSAAKQTMQQTVSPMKRDDGADRPTGQCRDGPLLWCRPPASSTGLGFAPCRCAVARRRAPSAPELWEPRAAPPTRTQLIQPC